MNQSYTTTFTVDQTPQAVFAAINHVRGWWSQAIEGETDLLGATFNYHYGDMHHCTITITEFVPGKKVCWHVVENYFAFTKDKTEWTGTDIVFDITKQGDKTEVQFTHVGLVPTDECYDVCANGWGTCISGSLLSLITTGAGQPNVEEAISVRERALN